MLAPNNDRVPVKPFGKDESDLFQVLRNCSQDFETASNTGSSIVFGYEVFEIELLRKRFMLPAPGMFTETYLNGALVKAKMAYQVMWLGMLGTDSKVELLFAYTVSKTTDVVRHVSTAQEVELLN